jgi:PilZ domain-containing protein
VERRRAVRFQLRAPVILEWTEPSGKKRENIGRTRDISILGTFVICPTPPPADTVVSVEVHLPPLERNTFQQLRLRGSGTVTRLNGSGQEVGFATHTPFVLEEGKAD